MWSWTALTLRTKARAIRHPQRLGDDRGQSIWRAIEQALPRMLSERPRGTTCSPARHNPRAREHPSHLFIWF